VSEGVGVGVGIGVRVGRAVGVSVAEGDKEADAITILVTVGESGKTMVEVDDRVTGTGVVVFVGLQPTSSTIAARRIITLVKRENMAISIYL
jgi:hypothetical protein